MPFVVADRVQENGTVATGTGSVSLAGAVDGYQSFASGIGNNNTTYYTIYDPTSYLWEVGLGTVTTGPNTLARTTVYANSAGTQPSKISFSTTNTLTVFVTYPASIAVYTAASASLNSLNLTSPITSSSNKGALNYGTLTYSDTDIFTSYQTSVNSYAQMILQNSNAGSAASADYVVSANGGTATTNYGNFGINSTNYTGAGPLNSPGMVYLYSQSADLTLGTNTSHAIHFTINNAAVDAMTINTSGSIAINGQTGSLGQVLISQGSSNPPSWGNAGGNVVVTDFIATAGQTTFSVSYVVGTVSVYRNGIRLALADYTATNGSTVVLASGAAAGDVIEIQSYTTLTLYSSITAQNFSGNGTQTVFTMNTNPANSASVLVAINGVTQDPSNYTVSGTTLTFSTAPAAGTNNVSVRYLGVPSTTSVSSFSAGTTGFSPTTAASGAVTLSGTLVVANGGTGLTTLATGRIPYGAGTAALNSSSSLTFDGTTLTTSALTSTGVATFSAGTVSAPAITTAGDTNTGIFFPAADTIAFSEGGVEAMRIDSNGNIGMGIAVPNGKLEVVGSSRVTGSSNRAIFQLYGASVSVDGAYSIQSRATRALTFEDDFVGAERFRIGPAGQLGIGGANYGTAGQVLTSQGSGSPPTWASPSAQIMLLAGGGGGGMLGGGGGAGGLINTNITLTAGAVYTITVGAAGAGSTNSSNNGGAGSASSISGTGVSISATGGGGGQSRNAGTTSAQNGGSGGGSSDWFSANTNGTGIAGQGNNGGKSNSSSNPGGGGGTGGGGGVASIGGSYSGSGTSGAGGSGVAFMAGLFGIVGGAGGGGGDGSSVNVIGGGAGGFGGGGNGGTGAVGANATNFGCGGGGGGNNYNGGNGSAGVVVLTVLTSQYTGTTTGSPTVAQYGIYTSLRFTSSGSYTA